jgi:hypothetical protein
MPVNMNYLMNGIINCKNKQKLYFVFKFYNFMVIFNYCISMSLFVSSKKQMKISKTSSRSCNGACKTKTRSNLATKLNVMIINAFQMGNDSNPLSPSTQQALALKDVSYMSIYEWIEMIEANGLYEHLFSVGHSDSLAKRVTALCKLLTKDGILRSLVMMDGHGRTLYLVIICLLHMGYTQEDIEGNIKVVDIDDGAVMWHNKFFPRGIESIESDIFDSYKEQMKVNPDTVFYFNFCGIKYEDNCHKVRDIMGINPNIMVSFSMERAAKKCKYIVMLKSYCDKNCVLVDDGNRLDFPTYITS